MRSVTLKPVAAAVLLGLLFLFTSLGLIASGRGVPAVFDGNETFSSILHAKNFLTFGPKASSGLADESTGTHAAAHPVVHTHQGNFPRLYAMLLSAVGLDSPASQVMATVLPVGTISIVVLFWALRRYGGTGIATATLAILITDYILFAQWQVVTYRVWHFAFAAALLALAISYREKADRRFLVGAFVISVILFYYELVFAAFLSASISIFVLMQWWRQIRKSTAFVAAQFCGALTGVVICTTQLVTYLGWDNFVSDIQLTYIGRNAGIDDPARLAALRAFVEQHNIAFFYNLVDGSRFRSIVFFLDSIFRWGFQVYTPPFVYSLLILAFSTIVAIAAPRGAIRAPAYAVAGIAMMTALGWLLGSVGFVFMLIVLGVALTIFAAVDRSAPPQFIGRLSAVMIVGVPAFVLFLMATTFSRFAGYERGDAAFWQFGVAFALASGALAALLVLRNQPERERMIPLDSALRGAGVICVAIAFSRFHYGLYDQTLAPLWMHAVPGFSISLDLQIAAMMVATGCAGTIAAVGPSLPGEIRTRLREVMRRVAILLAAQLAGFLVVVILFPGYVYSGYMVRYLNLIVLAFALIIGFVLYAMTKIAVSVSGQSRRRSSFTLQMVTAAGSMLLVIWWSAVQVANARLFPGTGFAVLRALEAMQSSQRTIVANTYPAPFSITTGQWSFADETFSTGRIVFSRASGYGYDFDRKYLWFADRATNPEYGKPDLFVCLLTPNFHSVALEVAKSEHGIRCADNGVVRSAMPRGDKTWPQHSLVASDTSGRDSWAIVKLDWDFPPFLSAAPAISAVGQGDHLALVVNYDFRHQTETPEYQTDIEIRTVSRNGSFCAVEGTALASLTARGGHVVFAIPQRDVGGRLIVIARPRTLTRVGMPVFGAPFRLDGQGTIMFEEPCGLLRDAAGRHWPRHEGD